MYHSITFGNDLLNMTVDEGSKNKRNTWSNWHLIPSSRPLVNPPSPSINRIPIPGGDGSLDVSELLAGRPTYSDRSGSWSFYAENGYMPWSSLFSEIMKYLHGQKMQCYLEDDPQYYYEGRFSVNEWRSDPARSMITINYVVNPYKKFYLGLDNWIWDTFYFGDPNDGSDRGHEIQKYSNIKVNAGQNKTINISGSLAGAEISVYTNQPYCKVTFLGETYNLKKNKYVTLSGAVITPNINGVMILRYDGYPSDVTLFDPDGKYQTAKFSININGGML